MSRYYKEKLFVNQFWELIEGLLTSSLLGVIKNELNSL